MLVMCVSLETMNVTLAKDFLIVELKLQKRNTSTNKRFGITI